MTRGLQALGLLMAMGLTGCQCGPGGLLGGGIRAGGGAGGCESGNCGLLSRMGVGASGGCSNGSCPSGNCGGLLSRLGRNGGACAETDGAMAPGYFPGGPLPGNAGGRLAGQYGYNHRAHQSQMGAQPGPAMGAPSPTYSYPYYTTRSPRDFLAATPPSIGY